MCVVFYKYRDYNVQTRNMLDETRVCPCTVRHESCVCACTVRHKSCVCQCTGHFLPPISWYGYFTHNYGAKHPAKLTPQQNQEKQPLSKTRNQRVSFALESYFLIKISGFAVGFAPGFILGPSQKGEGHGVGTKEHKNINYNFPLLR